MQNVKSQLHLVSSLVCFMLNSLKIYDDGGGDEDDDNDDAGQSTLSHHLSKMT